jgi:ABC-type glycerol-3-phosphate transport system substrate-binding protein
MLDNHDLERLESDLRIQAAGHHPRLSAEASARIQKRVYGQLRRAIMTQRTVKPALTYTALAVLIILAYYAGISLLNPPTSQEGAPQDNSLATPSLATPTAQPLTATPSPSSKPTIVKYYFASRGSTSANIRGEDAVVSSLMHAYNTEHTDVMITSVGINITTTDESLTSVASQADCFTWSLPQTYQSDSAVLDINTLAKTEGPDFLADFDPAMLADFSRQGKLIALPASSALFEVMSYNSDLLTQLGLQPPSPDWTFDDFLSYIQKVASAPGGNIGFLYRGDIFILHGRGVQWIDPTSDPLNIQINSPAMQDALAWIYSLDKSGAIRMVTNESWPQAADKLTGGKVAFWISSVDFLDSAFLDSGILPSFQIGTATMPVITGYQYPYDWYNERGHFISAISPNVQACWQWIKYLSEKKEALGAVPGRLSLRPQWDAFVGTKNYEIQYARAQRFDYNIPYNQIYYFPLNYWVSQAIQSTLLDKNTEQLLDIAQSKAENYQACWAGIDTTPFNRSQVFDQLMICGKQADPDWPFSP